MSAATEQQPELLLTNGPADLSPASHALRETVRLEATHYAERPILIAESFRASAGEPWREIRWARANQHLLANCPVRIRKGERLVGWHPNSRPDEETRARIDQAVQYLNTEAYWVGGSEGHMALDNPKILTLGLDGILAEIRERREGLDRLSPASPRPEVMYLAAETSLLALVAYVERYAALARELASVEPDAAWRTELELIGAMCEHLAHGPARSFREALQLAWFCYLGVALEASVSHHCFGLGRIDQYLLPYLTADRRAGTLDEDLVDELLDQAFIKCNEFAGNEMSAVIVGIGGHTPEGADGTNELSARALRASDRVRMYFPGVDIAWHKDMPAEFVRDACALLRNGNGQPSFFHDDAIIRGLMRVGLPYEHAVDHLPSTCTETSIQGRTNPWVAWPYMNLANCLLGALCGGIRPDDGERVGPATPLPESWEELLAAVDTHLQHTAEDAIAWGNRDQARAAETRPFPLLSCFIEGCLESGRNISHGGARYNFLQPEAVGVSNVVDSLAALKTLVFDEGRVTLAEFRRALADNWEGHEDLLAAVRRDCPKYGNDDPWVNDLFAWVTGRWCDHLEGHPNFFGGPVLPGFLGWTVWIGFGEQTAATPDGRHAGEPLANSLAPRSGVRLKGTPSTLLSAAGFDHSRGLGGTTFNIRFSRSALLEETGPERLRAIVETALGQLGIYMLQIEVTSAETMRAAQQDPASYADLLVRIGGYLVPFTLLPGNAQHEVIERAELGL